MKTTPRFWSGHRAERNTYLLIVIFFVLAPTVLSMRFPPVLGNDSAQLLLSWNYLIHTGTWVHTPTLLSSNIAVDTSQPLTWWTPGPTFLTGALEMLGLKWGVGLSLCLGIAAWAQLAGWKRLCLQWGFSSGVSLFTCLCIAASWFTLYSFRQFPGGDLFAMALLPWACLWLLQAIRQPWWQQLILITAVCVAGAFFKLSFIVTAIGLGLGASFADRGDRMSWHRVVRQAVPLGLGLAAAGALIYVGFLSRGISSPATSNASGWTWGELFHSAAMAASLPFSSLFAFESIGGRLCDLLGLTHLESNIPLLVLLLASAWVAYFWIWKTSPKTSYRAFAAGLFTVYLVMFTTLYTRHSAVSFEDRLFWPCGAVLLPGFAASGKLRRHRILRVFSAAVLSLGIIWGVGSYAYRLLELGMRDQQSERGYALRQIPESLDRSLRTIDRNLPQGNNLFVSPEPEALLAIHHNRFASLESGGEHRLNGRADILIVVLPDAFDAASVLARFHDYAPTGWHRRTVAHWSIWWQGVADLPL